ncbi:hypothetical protein [Leeuwenhoekiella sp. NPDC079379]|uniref:hypothetical protein n=1 Tax=Leeuwenhoekiella sp. NPDC079379 TaxID=3364122 RepID=UPI0037C908F9
MKKSIFKLQAEYCELTTYEKVMALGRRLDMLQRQIQGEKINLYILVDCNGKELEFPDIDERLANNPDIKHTPEEGDTIVVDGKYSESGECLMPDGITTIVFENGRVTDVIVIQNKSESKPASLYLETIFCNHGKELRIFGDKYTHALSVGNIIKVNNNAGVHFGKYKIGFLVITVINGIIAEISEI